MNANSIDIVSTEARTATANVAHALAPLFLEDPASEQACTLVDSWAQNARQLADEWPYAAQAPTREAFGLIENGLASWTTAPEANETERDDLRAEYHRLLIGPEHLQAPPWGSVYTDPDCVTFGATTLELRAWLRENGISFVAAGARAEDHIGISLELLGYLAENRPELQQPFLERHLLPWSSRYFELLAESAQHPFYRGIALLADATLLGMVERFNLRPAPMRLYF